VRLAPTALSYRHNYDGLPAPGLLMLRLHAPIAHLSRVPTCNLHRKFTQYVAPMRGNNDAVHALHLEEMRLPVPVCAVYNVTAPPPQQASVKQCFPHFSHCGGHHMQCQYQSVSAGFGSQFREFRLASIDFGTYIYPPSKMRHST
jgi:hypothetical protein